MFFSFNPHSKAVTQLSLPQFIGKEMDFQKVKEAGATFVNTGPLAVLLSPFLLFPFPVRHITSSKVSTGMPGNAEEWDTCSPRIPERFLCQCLPFLMTFFPFPSSLFLLCSSPQGSSSHCCARWEHSAKAKSSACTHTHCGRDASSWALEPQQVPPKASHTESAGGHLSSLCLS